jgi:hypothetical protein
MNYLDRPDIRLALARKLVERLVQFGFIEDRGVRSHAGAIVWYPTEVALELISGAQLATSYAGRRDYDETVSDLIRDGLLELDANHRWKPTELAETLLRLPCALVPPDLTPPHMLH